MEKLDSVETNFKLNVMNPRQPSKFWPLVVVCLSTSSVTTNATLADSEVQLR